MVQVCFLVPFHLEHVELVLVLRFLDRKVLVVVVVLVDREEGFHRRRHRLHSLVHHFLLLWVVLERVGDVSECMGMFPFIFLYLQGDNGTGVDYFLHQGNKLVVRSRPFLGHVILSQFVVTKVKKD